MLTYTAGASAIANSGRFHLRPYHILISPFLVCSSSKASLTSGVWSVNQLLLRKLPPWVPLLKIHVQLLLCPFRNITTRTPSFLPLYIRSSWLWAMFCSLWSTTLTRNRNSFKSDLVIFFRCKWLASMVGNCSMNACGGWGWGCSIMSFKAFGSICISVICKIKGSYPTVINSGRVPYWKQQNCWWTNRLTLDGKLSHDIMARSILHKDQPLVSMNILHLL